MNKSAIRELFKRYDFSFFGAMSAIFMIGFMNLYSATHSQSDVDHLYISQLLWFALALFIGFVVSFFKPKTFFRYSSILYLVNVVLLVLVLALGKESMGAQRWLEFGPIRFQPSELMKLSLVMALGRWFTRVAPEQEMGFKELIVPTIITLLPAGLIMLQPDLGTGLLLLFIFFTMSFYRRLKWKTIMIIFAIGVISGTVMYEYGLKEYQRKRIITFIDPAADARGSGYNAIQSKIAIGSGQFFGKGFKKSSQASLNYLPENHTDFVFSIFNEEHGFFGSLVLISLYIVLIYRFIWLATSVNYFYNSVFAIGVMSILFWHTFINMSMVMGLLPIVGIPLPLMSYGGTSLLTFGIIAGAVTSMSNARNIF